MDQSEFWNDYQHLQREVSHLRVAEERLKSLATLYKLLFKSSNQLIIHFDSSEIISEINPAGLKILNRTEKRVVGKECKTVFPHPKSSSICQRLSEVIKNKKLISFKLQVPGLTGPTLDFDATLVPVIDELDSCTGAILIAEDISENIDLNIEISDLKEELIKLKNEIDRPENS